MSNKKKKVYTWSEIEHHVGVLARILKQEEKQLTHITGIPRGGFIVATMLSHKLGLEYVSDYKQACKVNPKNLLLCDEINDTGKTFGKYTSVTPFDKCVTLVIDEKLSSDYSADYKAVIHQDDYWIEYPWEKK